MKKLIVLIILVFAINAHAGSGEWTKSSWQKVNGVTDIPGPVSIDGDAEVGGDLTVGGEAKISGSLSIQETATSVLTGSINPTASTAVTGVGTKFLSELVTGDKITVSAETRAVVAIASDTALTVGFAFTDVANDTSPDRVPALFTGRDSDGTLKYVQYDNAHIEQLASGFTGPGWNVVNIQNAWRATQIENNTGGGRVEWGFGDGSFTPWSMRGTHTISNPTVTANEIECWTWDGAVHTTNLGAAYKCLTIGPGHDEKVIFYGGGRMTINTTADDSTGNTIGVTAFSRIESGQLRGTSITATNAPNVGASSTDTTGIEVAVQNGGDQDITGNMVGGSFAVSTANGNGNSSSSIGLRVGGSHAVGTLTDFKGILIESPSDSSGVWTNNYAMYIEAQDTNLTTAINAGIWLNPSSNATANYGIVLDGDGAGADLVLGDTQQTKISNNATADELTVTGVGGFKLPVFTYATLPAACTEGTLVIVTDDDDCITSASGDGAICVCTNATNTWTVLKDY